MAFDPNDEADVKLLDDKIAEAVEGLKKKNTDLLAKIAKVKSTDPEDVARLERELSEATEKLETETKAHKEAQKQLTKVSKNLETESTFTKTLLVDNGLTEALVKANVSKHLLEGAKALISPKVQIVTEGDKRVVKIGDEALGDYVTKWAQGDQGKAYVAAPSNNGGNANGGQANGSGTGKSVTRAVWDGMDHAARTAHSKENGTVTD
jgi:hypothetical protein